MSQQGPQVRDLLSALNSPIDGAVPRIGIVLAAGHGKRIRSETSKMLHEIWGRPTGLRVAQAVQQGLDSPNQIIVVGIKGTSVAQATGAQPGRFSPTRRIPYSACPPVPATRFVSASKPSLRRRATGMSTSS